MQVKSHSLENVSDMYSRGIRNAIVIVTQMLLIFKWQLKSSFVVLLFSLYKWFWQPQNKVCYCMSCIMLVFKIFLRISLVWTYRPLHGNIQTLVLVQPRFEISNIIKCNKNVNWFEGFFFLALETVSSSNICVWLLQFPRKCTFFKPNRTFSKKRTQLRRLYTIANRASNFRTIKPTSLITACLLTFFMHIDESIAYLKATRCCRCVHQPHKHSLRNIPIAVLSRKFWWLNSLTVELPSKMILSKMSS